MNTAELDYKLPDNLIAQQPLPDRTCSRLMVLHRDSGRIEHRRFHDLADYLKPGDCMVLNDSKVVPARFFLRRTTGGRIEGLFLKINDEGNWQVMLKNASRLKPDETVLLGDPYNEYAAIPDRSLTVLDNLKEGLWLIRPRFSEDAFDVLDQYGLTPLPPYIRRDDRTKNEKTDRTRYQSVYAKTAGSVAAPTAGLHFGTELITTLREAQIEIAHITLHVGLGTFKAIATGMVEEHLMHSEFYRLDETNAARIAAAGRDGRRVVAVGTTSVRTVETAACDGLCKPGSGWTNLFITPGYSFRVVNTLITNFHLPRTSLLALVCAFAGTEQTLAAYRLAVELKYRFYSYGDAMLIL